MVETSKQLEEVAISVLRKYNGDIDKALPQFLQAVKKRIDDLARSYLGCVVWRSGEGHVNSEAQSACAPATPPIPVAMPDIGSIKVRQHDVRQHRRRTQAEKDAAEKAMMTSAEAVFDRKIKGRPLGKITYGELPALRRELVADASANLMLGIDQVRDIILLEKIEQHGKVPDQMMSLKEGPSASNMSRFDREAEIEAPQRLMEVIHQAEMAMTTRTVELSA